MRPNRGKDKQRFADSPRPSNPLVQLRSPHFVPAFNRTLRVPNCRELLGRKFRLQWVKERDGGGIYFRVKVHMDQSQYAAVGFATRG